MTLKLLVPLSFVALATNAMAEGFYGVGEVTHSMNSLDRDYFDNALNSAGAVGLSSGESTSGNYWRLQGGYRFNENFALEAGYIDLGKATYKADFNGGSAKGSLKAGGLDAAAVLSLPLNDSLAIFAKGGMIAAKVEAHLTADASVVLPDNNSSVNEVRPLFGFGAVYKISQEWDIRADYDQVNGLGKSTSTGTMDSKMMSLGVVYKF